MNIFPFSQITNEDVALISISILALTGVPRIMIMKGIRFRVSEKTPSNVLNLSSH